jgi:tryptophan synthase alpha chain
LAQRYHPAMKAVGALRRELGITYGDPLVDGPTIAAAGQRALLAGTTLESSFQLVERLHQLVPIVLFSYLNPVLQFRVERFAAPASAAGAGGVIIPDVTLEEIAKVRDSIRAHGLAFPLLVAPTKEAERGQRIAEASDGFVNLVSRMGVTGKGTGPNAEWLRNQVGQLRQVSPKPMAVGCEISTPEKVAAVAPFSDGVIVGSALVSSFVGARVAEAARMVGTYIASLTAVAAKQPAGR